MFSSVSIPKFNAKPRRRDFSPQHLFGAHRSCSGADEDVDQNVYDNDATYRSRAEYVGCTAKMRSDMPLLYKPGVSQCTVQLRDGGYGTPATSNYCNTSNLEQGEPVLSRSTTTVIGGGSAVLCRRTVPILPAASGEHYSSVGCIEHADGHANTTTVTVNNYGMQIDYCCGRTMAECDKAEEYDVGGSSAARDAAYSRTALLRQLLRIKQQFRHYRTNLAQKMSAKASATGGVGASGVTTVNCYSSANAAFTSNTLAASSAAEHPAHADASYVPRPKQLQHQLQQQLLNVAQIVRQQSDATHTNRRLKLSRSRALLFEDDVAAAMRAGLPPQSTVASVSAAAAKRDGDCDGDVVAASASAQCGGGAELSKSVMVSAKRNCSSRPGTSCDHGDDYESTGTMSSILLQPTRLVTVVDQQANENYIQLNQYRLMEEIGQGSYGIVKLAYNEKDKNLYAMKVLDKLKLVKNFACFRPPPQRKNKAAPSAVHRNPLQLVQREIAILKKLHHPNVVKLVEVLDDPNDNYLYMVFEYVEKRSLMDLPTDTPLDEHVAWKYFRDTLKGLEYLHFQKIVHRDIKPSNLLLSETGQVKIADFGVSCEFEGIDAFLTGTAGTPAFMAPEALSEASSLFYSGRAQDIWSLGITLYALVYGNVPFWDAYVIALHKKIKNDPVSFPDKPEISDSLKALILGMLKKDPGHRLLLQEIKLHDWVVQSGAHPMPSEEENCQLVTVTEEEIENCVRIIPRLDTLILVKAMGHRKRFGNPFRNYRNSTDGSAAGSGSHFRRKSSSLRDPHYVPPPSVMQSAAAAALGGGSSPSSEHQREQQRLRAEERLSTNDVESDDRPEVSDQKYACDRADDPPRNHRKASTTHSSTRRKSCVGSAKSAESSSAEPVNSASSLLSCKIEAMSIRTSGEASKAPGGSVNNHHHRTATANKMASATIVPTTTAAAETVANNK